MGVEGGGGGVEGGDGAVEEGEGEGLHAWVCRVCSGFLDRVKVGCEPRGVVSGVKVEDGIFN